MKSKRGERVVSTTTPVSRRRAFRPVARANPPRPRRSSRSTRLRSTLRPRCRRRALHRALRRRHPRPIGRRRRAPPPPPAPPSRAAPSSGPPPRPREHSHDSPRRAARAVLRLRERLPTGARARDGVAELGDGVRLGRLGALRGRSRHRELGAQRRDGFRGSHRVLRVPGLHERQRLRLALASRAHRVGGARLRRRRLARALGRLGFGVFAFAPRRRRLGVRDVDAVAEQRSLLPRPRDQPLRLGDLRPRVPQLLRQRRLRVAPASLRGGQHVAVALQRNRGGARLRQRRRRRRRGRRATRAARAPARRRARRPPRPARASRGRRAARAAPAGTRAAASRARRRRRRRPRPAPSRPGARTARGRRSGRRAARGGPRRRRRAASATTWFPGTACTPPGRTRTVSSGPHRRPVRARARRARPASSPPPRRRGASARSGRTYARAAASATRRRRRRRGAASASASSFFAFDFCFFLSCCFLSSSASAISSATTNSGSSAKSSGSRLAASYGSEARTWSPGGSRVHARDPRSRA